VVLLFLSSIQLLQVLTQEGLCRAARASASRFPVLQGLGADAQPTRKVLLAEGRSLPCLGGLGDQIYCTGGKRCLPAWGLGDGDVACRYVCRLYGTHA
jgi:hypothetical protein